eukprot:CAMPEP_0115729858 /NCGR_PEP_ID=MMETSP0272-20121206/83738_1 /TAXON_ID=71861 /ORGANISM="Scrippsiella trochoidea, Strain CCMP3099" /LENGTH=146 /DNA_ID=CAMNT_0003173581 /DNA_START=89 /DNA_END=525 /DNA_ORIENTATION=-
MTGPEVERQQATRDYGAGPEYWDARYRSEPLPYEWLRDYEEVVQIIEEATASDRSCKILHVGCGNSLLSERLYDDGYRDVISIDSSPVVVAQMAARTSTTARPGLQYFPMDATATSFADGTFDLVLDKALVDTLACLPGACSAEVL